MEGYIVDPVMTKNTHFSLSISSHLSLLMGLVLDANVLIFFYENTKFEHL
jgi:hypothetical protein